MTFSPPRFPFPERESRPVAITQTTVIPVDRDGSLPGHTVVVRDGVIETVAPSGEISTAGMRVIDGRGRYVVPALSDMHVHLRDQADVAHFLANGVAYVRNLWGRPQLFRWEQLVQEGTLPGPHATTVSPLVDGVGDEGLPIWPGSVAITDPARAAPLIASFARRGYRELKVYSWLTKDVLVALCRAAEEHGMKITGHCPEGLTFEEAMDAGQRCFEHLTAFAYGHLKDGKQLPRLRGRDRNSNTEAVRLMATEIDWDAVRRLAEEMARRGAWACPTIVVWDGQGQTLDDALRDPDLVHAGPLVEWWKGAFMGRRAGFGIPESEWAVLARGRTESHARATKVMFDAGVPVMLGTDTPNPFVVPGYAVHRETRLLRGAGLRAIDVLRAATLVAARYRGEDDSAGSVTPGKRGDLLLVDGDPLADVSALRRIDHFVVNGYVLDRTTLDALVASAAAMIGPSEAPTPRLGAMAAGRTLEGEGTLDESGASGPPAVIAYRHTRGRRGTIVVEEEQLSRGERMTRVLELADDLTLRAGRFETENWMGKESATVEWRDGRYDSSVVEIDGWKASGSLPSAPLIPAARLAATIWPRLLVANERTAIESIDLVGESPARVTNALERRAGTDGIDREWIVRSGMSAMAPASYQLRADGMLLGATVPNAFGPRMLRVRTGAVFS